MKNRYYGLYNARQHSRSYTIFSISILHRPLNRKTEYDKYFIVTFCFQKYAALLEKEKVGAAELPYVGEDKLRALGVPLGPRMRILKEAGIHQELHHMSRDDHNTTTTTLAIVWDLHNEFGILRH